MKQRTVLTLTAALCELDVDNESCCDCGSANPALDKIDVFVKLTDVGSFDTVTVCFSDCCSQLCIVSRLFSTSGDGRTPELPADTTMTASFDLAFVKLFSRGCSRANSVTDKQPNTKCNAPKYCTNTDARHSHKTQLRVV